MVKNCASSGVRWEGPRIVEGLGVAFCGHPQIAARPVSLLCTCLYLHPAKIAFVESCAQDHARHCEHLSVIPPNCPWRNSTDHPMPWMRGTGEGSGSRKSKPRLPGSQRHSVCPRTLSPFKEALVPVCGGRHGLWAPSLASSLALRASPGLGSGSPGTPTTSSFSAPRSGPCGLPSLLCQAPAWELSPHRNLQ